MTRRIVVLAPFFEDDDAQWLDDHVEADGFDFIKVIRPSKGPSWHARGAKTPFREWRDFWAYAGEGLAANPDVLVTVFPQLPLVAALRKRLSGNRAPIIAATFNLGDTSNRLKGWLAGRVMANVSLFLVHSSEEVTRYAQWLGLPEERFRYMALQRGAPEHERQEEAEAPYVLSMGSAGRDYETFVAAMGELGYPTLIIAKPELTATLPAFPNIEYLSGLTLDECMRLLAAARINVVPISNQKTASGQVTFLSSMAYGVPTIATDCPGTRDYLEDGVSAVVVPPKDVAAMKQAVAKLWEEKAHRDAIARGGKESWRTQFSDKTAGATLAHIISEV